jgi:glycosyltransferase involved in cell wall biosynthesis
MTKKFLKNNPLKASCNAHKIKKLYNCYKNHPEIEIICSIYNGGESLLKTIQTIQYQSFTNWVCTLIDDNSNDDFTQDILRKASNKDSRIKIYRNSSRLGLTKNLVNAVARSKANVIARADAGDWWDQKKLAKQVECLNEKKDVVCVGTQCHFVSAENKIIGRSLFAEKDNQIKRNLKIGLGIFIHSSIAFRRILNYREEFKYSQDLDLYMRLSFLGKLECLRSILTFCSINQKGITLEKKPWQRKYQELAFKSFSQVKEKKKKTILKIQKPSKLNLFLWKKASRFYCSYALNAISERRLISYFWLCIACFIYPYLVYDYAKKYFRFLYYKVLILEKE